MVASKKSPADEVRAILEQWFSGKRYLLAHDRGVLKRALKAFRKIYGGATRKQIRDALHDAFVKAINTPSS
ncbi:MAG: hypothetical protein IH884_10875 [Myxococcales bacterium]|nr:hypothetical protein [Myxococcales bacterium]